MVKRLKEDKEKFYLIWPEPECVNVCFWYLPKRLRKVSHTAELENELGRVSFSMKLVIISLSNQHLSREKVKLGKYMYI